MVTSKPSVSELGIKAGEPKIKIKEERPRPDSFTSQFWRRSALWSADLIIYALIRRDQHINKHGRLLPVLRSIKNCLLTDSTIVAEQRNISTEW